MIGLSVVGDSAPECKAGELDAADVTDLDRAVGIGPEPDEQRRLVFDGHRERPGVVLPEVLSSLLQRRPRTAGGGPLHCEILDAVEPSRSSGKTQLNSLEGDGANSPSDAGCPAEPRMAVAFEGRTATSRVTVNVEPDPTRPPSHMSTILSI